MPEINQGQEIESEEAARKSGLSDVELWLKKIKQAQKDEEKWREGANEAIRVYEADEKDAPAFNVLHSNIETLIPALYNSTPVPDVRRRFSDKDPIGKHVSDLSERSVSYTIDQFDFDAEMDQAIRDAALTGRGILRLRYMPEVSGQVITAQKMTLERVPWDRFIRGPARSWSKVPWIAFEHDMTAEELESQFGARGKEVTVGTSDSDRKSEQEKKEEAERGILKTATVYEIWDKAKRQVIFITDQDKGSPLKVIKDPLKLENFYPLPRIIEPLKRVSSLTPVCPYTIWKPLFLALDKVTKRIDKLVGQLKVRGLVDGSLEADIQKLQTCDDGQYEVATDATAFATGAGGLEKAIAHWPMEPTVAALQQLELIRSAIKAFIDEVTGVSDILRGNVDPREKLGQSQIKTQWGSLRLQVMQNSIAATARDAFRMMVEVMATFYQPQILSQMTGLPQTPEQRQVWPQVMEVFKSDVMRSYRVDIETNSTIRADTTKNQEQMNAFLQGTAQFSTAMVELVPIAPQALPAIMEVFTAFARQFKLGKQAEDALDELGQQAPQMAQAMQNKPDPEADKAKQEMAMKQMDAQAQQQQNQADLQLKGMDLEMKKMELVGRQMEMQHQHTTQQFDMQARQQSAEIDQRGKSMDVDNKRQMLDMDRQGRQQELFHRDQMASQEMAHKQRAAELDIGAKQEASNIALTQSAKERGLARGETSEEMPMPIEDKMMSVTQQTAQQMSELQMGLGQALQQIGQMLQALDAGQAEVLKSIKAPRAIKLVKGKDGKTVGATSVLSNGALN